MDTCSLWDYIFAYAGGNVVDHVVVFSVSLLLLSRLWRVVVYSFFFFFILHISVICTTHPSYDNVYWQIISASLLKSLPSRLGETGLLLLFRRDNVLHPYVIIYGEDIRNRSVYCSPAMPWLLGIYFMVRSAISIHPVQQVGP
jgi:hypothetical protein